MIWEFKRIKVKTRIGMNGWFNDTDVTGKNQFSIYWQKKANINNEIH